MTDDATLSDFTSTGESNEADGDEPVSSDDGASASGSDPDASAIAAEDGREPAARSDPPGDTELSTYAWGQYACDRCDAETDRVWREDGALVCPECKSW